MRRLTMIVLAGWMVGTLLFVLAGCASQTRPALAVPAAAATPNLEAIGAAALAEDRRKLDQMGQVVTQCMGGVQKLLALCPHVPKSEPFDRGVNDCLKEAQAHERK